MKGGDYMSDEPQTPPEPETPPEGDTPPNDDIDG